VSRACAPERDGDRCRRLRLPVGMVSKDAVRRNQTTVYVVAALIVGFAYDGTGFGWAINPVLAALLYVTFLEVPFVRVRAAFRDTRFVAAALCVNFVAVPFVVAALTVPVDSPRVLVGALMVLLTPCVDYVITFTELAGGDSERITATTPALMLVQLALLPFYLWLFMGSEVADVVEPGPFVESFVLIIALPLLGAWATQSLAERSARAATWDESMGWLPVPMMGMTLFVVIASQLPRVRGSFGEIVGVVPVYAAFLIVMPLVAGCVASALGMGTGESRALVFTSTTRNSLVVLPLALALTAGYALAPAVVVTQTLVELTGMVALTRAVPAWLVPDGG